MDRSFSILVIPDKKHPLNHALLENIFYKILPDQGHKIYWLLPSVEAKRFGMKQQWGKTQVILSPFPEKTTACERIKYSFYTRIRSMFIMGKLVKENDIDDVLVAVGGIIPEEDKVTLGKLGLAGFHGPGTELKEVVEFVRNNLKR